jgi:acyl-CoA reductase-like NAD-dependent aldehyde dehydrogenase
MFIDGEHINCSFGESMDVLNPATGKVIERVPAATPEDISKSW